MVKKTVGWLDNQTTNEPKKIIKEKINDVSWAVHQEISEDFQKNKETTETITKSLEFEKDTFKIDSKWWKETIIKWWRKVKTNWIWDVLEYLDGDAKWEQIFITYDAFIREVCKAKNCNKEEVEKKYLMTTHEFEEKMKDKPSGSEEYKKFFNDEIKGYLSGYWHPIEEDYGVGKLSNVWLSGWFNAYFDQNESDWSYNGTDLGFSGRLLKN